MGTNCLVSSTLSRYFIYVMQLCEHKRNCEVDVICPIFFKYGNQFKKRLSDLSKIM